MRAMAPFLYARHAWIPGLVAAASLLIAACASPDAACQQQHSSCITRCEAATDNRDLARNSMPPQSTMTECEQRCACREPSTSPKPQGRPTLTGTAQ